MKMRKAWAGVAAVAAAVLVSALGAAPSPAFAATDATTLQKEIASGAVKLEKDITASVEIPEGANVTIDLNGRTLTADSKWAAITNNGHLTVTDSVGGGKVDGADVSQTAALYNAPTGTATLNAGTFTGSKWYVIKNLGNMTIDGAAVIQNDAGTSGIDNGYYGNAGNDCNVAYPSSAEVNLTIKSGSFSNGMNAVKNDDFGTLVVNGGTFSNTDGPAILNWNVAEINDGQFIAADGVESVIANGSYATTVDQGKLTINGGTFTASNGGTANIFAQGVGGTDGGTVTVTAGNFAGSLANLDQLQIGVTVSGGTFSDENVIKHVAAGDAVVKSTNGFSVMSDEEASNTSLAKIVVNGTNVYFDSVDDAKAYAKEKGYSEEDVKVVNYVVTFVANGETTDVYLVKVGEPLGELPKIPEYEGHTVDGWYVDVTEGTDGSATGTKIDETYVPTGDTTVTAMWTENPVTPSTPAADTKPAAEAPKKALPQTGDNTDVVLPAVIAGVGIVVIAAALIVRRHHN